MHWLQRIFPLRLWPFIIFVFILAAVLLGGDYYRGLLKRRGLARVATTVRRAIADKTRVPELKMERSTLEFQLDGLPRKFPILTNAALARDWSSSASLARLDQDVDEAWNSYWKQVSPLVLEVNHRLEFFVALQTAYDLDVGQIIRDWTITNKPAVLLNLQANKFASLFTNPVCLDDRKEFEAAAAKITDDKILNLREAYWTALAPEATKLNPKLRDYGRAALALETKSAEIKQQMSALTEQLRDLGEVPDAATGESVETATVVHAPEPPLNSREFFKTYIPRSGDFVTIEIATIIIGFLITQPMELRSRRWLKIGASMALVYWGLLTLEVPVRIDVTQRQDSILAFLRCALPAVFLAAIWTGDICYFAAKIAMNLIDSPEMSGPPVSPHRSARLAANRGDLEDALRLVKSKRAEDHGLYETLLLKAKLHQQMNHRWRAKWTLKKALRKPDLTDSQRQHVEYLLACVDDRTNACWKI